MNNYIRRIYLLAAVIYWALSSVLHLKVSLFIISPLPDFLPQIRPSEYISHLLVILAAFFFLWIIIRVKKRSVGPITIICAGLWCLAVFGANRFLVSTGNEYVHYPQYAILSILLYKAIKTDANPSPFARVLFWVTLMGIIDETIQYFYICPSYGDYLDFNDFVLNELGAVGGLVIIASKGCNSYPAHNEPHIGKAEIGTAGATVMLISLLALSGLLQITPPREIPPGGTLKMNGNIKIFVERKPGILGTWQKAQGAGRYYVLTPLEGAAIIFVIWMTCLFCESTAKRRRLRG